MFISPKAEIAKTGRSVDSSTGYWVTRLARAMECDFENRLSVHGVTRIACAILGAIAIDNKSTAASLASFIGVDAAAMTRHLESREKRGAPGNHIYKVGRQRSCTRASLADEAFRNPIPTPKAHFEGAHGLTLLRSNRVVATGRVLALAFGELLE